MCLVPSKCYPTGANNSFIFTRNLLYRPIQSSPSDAMEEIYPGMSHQKNVAKF